MASSGEALLVCSNLDAGITIWDLASGAHLSHLKSCASPRNALVPVGPHLLAASQLPKPGSTSGGAIFFWSWNKTQPELKSYPVEPIISIAATSDGAYIAGGGLSGRIYIWEVPTGNLFRVWAGHYKSITCLLFSDDESLLVSGAEDGFVNVWPLLRVMDTAEVEAAEVEAQVSYLYTWSAHTLSVTGLACGYGGSSAVIVSCSLDTSCKIWSLGLGRLLRTIKFPVAINTVILDPGEYAMYAGSLDGRIFVASLNLGIPDSSADCTISALIGHSRAITTLAFSMDGVSLISGSEDCSIYVWDTSSQQTLRILKHNKGPISNILVISWPITIQHEFSTDSQASSTSRRASVLSASPLSKYVMSNSSTDCTFGSEPVVLLHSTCHDSCTPNISSHSSSAMEQQIKELEHQDSVVAMKLELEKLKNKLQRAINMSEQWRQLHDYLYNFYLQEIGEKDDDNDYEQEGDKSKKSRSKVMKSRET